MKDITRNFLIVKNIAEPIAEPIMTEGKVMTK